MSDARGLIVGIGRLFNLRTNTPYPVQAGFSLSGNVTAITAPSGASAGTISAPGAMEFTGSFGFRESAPEVWADIYGGDVQTGAEQAAFKLAEEELAISTDTITLSADVKASLTGTNRTAVLVKRVGSFSPLEVVTTSPSAGQVQYAIDSDTLTFNAAEFADGVEFEIAYLTSTTSASNKTWEPDPKVLPQPLHLLAALRLRQPYLHLNVGSGVVVEVAAAELSGESGGPSGPIADFAEHTVNYTAQWFQKGDIRVTYNVA